MEDLVDEYTVEFRIHGTDLNIASVTEQLRLEPSLVRNVGDHRSKTTRWEQGMWSYNGNPDSAACVTWSSLEDGLVFVLEKLWPVKNEIDTLKEKYEVTFWCGHFHSGPNDSIRLSPDILMKLGDFGVELFIDSYSSMDADPEKPLGVG